MSETILITGSNRGIGLELAKQYAESGWRVLACCRSPDNAGKLSDLADQYNKLSIHKLDVTDSGQIQSLVNELQDQPLDILFNNAGVYGPYDAGFENVNETEWLECLRVNTIAPMLIIQAFVENVAMSERKLIATMSSKMGSMTDNGSGGSYVYRSSKAALNAVMKSASIDLRPRGIKVAILHPGWVLTDMGGPNAEINVNECVNNLRKNINNVNLENTGCFLEIDGSVIPW